MTSPSTASGAIQPMARLSQQDPAGRLSENTRYPGAMIEVARAESCAGPGMSSASSSLSAS